MLSVSNINRRSSYRQALSLTEIFFVSVVADQCECGLPPLIPNGYPGTPTDTSTGGTVIYMCNDGYTISGLAIAFCELGSWERLPRCIGT